ncbi:MAG TPA: OmpA family protein [Flavipsychrobacter sp.]
MLTVSMLLCVTHWCFANSDTTRVYFRLDNPRPEPEALRRIDSLLYTDVINSSQELLIIGYADHLGTNAYNEALSEERADHVRDYLQSMGIPEKNITLVTGKGEVPRDVELPDGYAADRRVDIVILTGKAKPPVVVRKQKVVQPKKTESRDAVRLNIMTDFDSIQFAPGQLFVLDKIFFHTGRHVVVDESLPEMQRLYEVLDENPTLVINIEGHVCCVHPSVDALDLDTGELKLSVNRAKFIYEYLVKRGIESGRLSYEGFGKKRPLKPLEFTQEDQDMNKRVEIRVLKN